MVTVQLHCLHSIVLLLYVAGHRHTCTTCHKMLGQQEISIDSSTPRQDERADVGLKDGRDERHKHVSGMREQEVIPDLTEQHHVAQEEEKEHKKPTYVYDDENKHAEPIVRFVFLFLGPTFEVPIKAYFFEGLIRTCP